MRKKVLSRIGKGVDIAMTLTCSFAISGYIVYYGIFKYKGAARAGKKECRN